MSNPAFFSAGELALMQDTFGRHLTRVATIKSAKTGAGALGFTGTHTTTTPTARCKYEPIPPQRAAGLIEVLGAEPGFRVRFAIGQANVAALKGGDLIEVDGLIFEVVRPPQPRTDDIEAEALCVQRQAQG